MGDRVRFIKEREIIERKWRIIIENEEDTSEPVVCPYRLIGCVCLSFKKNDFILKKFRDSFLEI
jgi:hypothetical protein